MLVSGSKTSWKYIRSVTEYCLVALHPSLTLEESQTLERIQKTCLRIILGDMYVSYDSALEMSGLRTLYSKREKICLDFALKRSSTQEIRRCFLSIIGPMATPSLQKKNVLSTGLGLENIRTLQSHIARDS